MKPRVYLSAVGDTNSPVTWSGIPYYFLQAGRERGVFDQGLSLTTTGRPWRARRLTWNLAQVLGGDRSGGYQYSLSFLEKLWKPVLSQVQDSVIVNCFQLFPPGIVANQRIEKWFFIDQTLLQLFDHYGLRRTVGRRIAQEAVARERDGYHKARGIIAHSNWAATSLLRDYGVAANRIHVVVPGASFDAEEYAHWDLEYANQRDAGDTKAPLRLVFVGKEWRRKGLDRLLQALRLARRSSAGITLRVIGCQREDLPVDLQDVDGVEWLGFIDKQREPARFLRSVGECDVGCLLSRAEAGGIAIREYHALGLPVIGTDCGGAPEHVIPGASIVTSNKATAEELSKTLLLLDKSETKLDELRRVSLASRRTALWEMSMESLLKFWPHRVTAQVEISSADAPNLNQINERPMPLLARGNV